jgi:D-cysteine desulfhydrase
MISLFEEIDSHRHPLTTCIPTPIEYNSGLSAELEVEVYFKRDDLLDHWNCGNKIRKLEYILFDALANRCDTVITAGSPYSNQCKAVAIHARSANMHSHLLFCGAGLNDAAAGNLALTCLFADRISTSTPEKWPSIDFELHQLAEKEKAQGARPYIIPPGASSWPGYLGYIRMAQELAFQEKKLGLRFDVILVLTGSCGTHAGLAIGAKAACRNWRIIGIPVFGNAALFDPVHKRIFTDFRRRYPEYSTDCDLKLEVYDQGGEIIYGTYCEADIAEIARVCRAHSILFDPVYGLHLLSAAKEMRRTNQIRTHDRVLLVHTGGQHILLGAEPNLVDFVKRRLSGG